MTVNKFGGNKARKGKNSTSDSKKEKYVPEPNKAEGTCVAKITGLCGDCRFRGNVVTEQGIQNREIMFHLPKGSRKYGRVTSGCYVLASVRDFDQNRGDILYTYKDNQLFHLKNRRYIPDTVEVDEYNEETGFVFSGETTAASSTKDRVKRSDDPYQPVIYLSDEEEDNEQDDEKFEYDDNINLPSKNISSKNDDLGDGFGFEGEDNQDEIVSEKTNEAMDLFGTGPKKENLSKAEKSKAVKKGKQRVYKDISEVEDVDMDKIDFDKI